MNLLKLVFQRALVPGVASRIAMLAPRNSATIDIKKCHLFSSLFRLESDRKTGHRLVSHLTHAEDFLDITLQPCDGLFEGVIEGEHRDRDLSKVSHSEALGTLNHQLQFSVV